MGALFKTNIYEGTCKALVERRKIYYQNNYRDCF